ncbi:MAG: glucose-6-phosphate isomerase family protein [Paludibacter sp.]
MSNENIKLPELFFLKEKLIGKQLVEKSQTIATTSDIYSDQEALKDIDVSQKAYDVSCYLPVEEGTTGGLYFGITKIYPGKVGNEYFMTKGHFHINENSSEYYWGIEGEGVLILMDENRNVTAEKVVPGSLHYIPGGIAHRMANIGNEVFSFAACWPADAGHNYEEIANRGFAKRLMGINGVPTLI